MSFQTRKTVFSVQHKRWIFDENPGHSFQIYVNAGMSISKLPKKKSGINDSFEAIQ